MAFKKCLGLGWVYFKGHFKEIIYFVDVFHFWTYLLFLVFIIIHFLIDFNIYLHFLTWVYICILLYSIFHLKEFKAIILSLSTSLAGSHGFYYPVFSFLDTLKSHYSLDNLKFQIWSSPCFRDCAEKWSLISKQPSPPWCHFLVYF